MKLINLIALMFLITLGSVGAVIFVSGLPQIATYFDISEKIAGYSISWYLIGYALGQLIYGPLSNRFGSKTSLKIGISIATLGTIGCILSYYSHLFTLLVISRLILALGAASGPKITFTWIGKVCNKQESARIISIVMVAFAIAPGLSVYIGSILITSYNWVMPLYFMIFYCFLVLLMSLTLKEVYAEKDFTALKIKNIVTNYAKQFANVQLICGGLLVGSGTSIIYAFAAIAPFIVITRMHLAETTFGLYNIIPSIGILIGSVASSYMSTKLSTKQLIGLGLSICTTGIIILGICAYYAPFNVLGIFISMLIINFGFSFIFANATAITLANTKDTANASAVINFINMGYSYLVVSLLEIFAINTAISLAIVYVLIIILSSIYYRTMTKKFAYS